MLPVSIKVVAESVLIKLNDTEKLSCYHYFIDEIEYFVVQEPQLVVQKDIDSNAWHSVIENVKLMTCFGSSSLEYG